MTHRRPRNAIVQAMLGTAACVAAGAALAQATHDTADIPQPHLQKARKYAAQENAWRHPGLSACYWDEGQASQNVNKHPAGAKVFDQVYYVGNGKYGPYAIDTGEGIILIDAMNNREQVDQYILTNMRNVGLDPKRLKILILSHGHSDHFGGAQYLRDLYGVRIYLSDVDWDYAINKEKLRPEQGKPPARDLTVKDGDTIRLGDMAIKVFVTPGHSPGALSMLIPVTDKGQPRTMLYAGGVTSKLLSPEAHAAFDRSYDRLIDIARKEKVDGYLSAHPNYDDAVFKTEIMRSNPALPNPFVKGTRETVLFLQQVKECNLNAADIDRLKPNRKTTGFVPSP